MARFKMDFDVPDKKVEERPIGFDAHNLDEFNYMADVVWRSIVQTWPNAIYKHTLMEVPWKPPH